MTTLLEAWKAAQTTLKAGKIDSPAIDARLLVEAATGASRTEIITDPYREVPAEQLAQLDAWVERRTRREPVARIIGRKGFWKIMLTVTPDTLIPRPDTEVLIDETLRALPEENAAAQVLDMGTGSGAVALAVLSERPAVKVVATDVSEEALAVARENAANLGLQNRLVLLRTSWASGLPDAAFDLVLSNPPYIGTAEIEALDPEVRDHDPRLALDGGPDGLDAYRDLIPQTMRVLKPGGRFALEIGSTQAQAVMALAREAGFRGIRTVRDLGDRDRVVVGSKAEA